MAVIAMYPTAFFGKQKACPKTSILFAMSQWKTLLENIEQSAAQTKLGGGSRALDRQHQKNRLGARERIAALIDPDSRFDELFLFAAHEMYPEAGGCPSAGTVVGIGQIAGRDWLVIANDATVKAGAFFPMTAKKVIRAQTIAFENKLPVVYLVDSAGVYLPMQDEIFPDQDDFGRVFYLNARLSAAGVPQIAAIMGNCVAGGAYLPVMCDTLIMTEGSGLYLAAPALVKAAIGQVVDSEDLGGAAMHAAIAGTVDYREPDDASALRHIRELAGFYALPDLAPWAKRRIASRAPTRAAQDLLELVSSDGSKPYETKEVIAALFDTQTFAEYKAEYGQTLVTGFARLGGYPVGIVANQRSVIKKPGKLEVGGVIYAEAADKALIFLSDVTGFMVGRDSEHAGIIRRGAKMVNAVSNSVVPKITLITGGSFGAGNYAMSGKAYAPRFIYAWASAKYAVMSGNAAAKTLLDIQLAQLERNGHKPDELELQELFSRIKQKYDSELDPRYAAARLWVDEIISPLHTRERLVRSLDVCALEGSLAPFRTGVFQV
jgi:3-methylcrotonyl-CoA carboxylase beta subunit